jgi:hypothetical protein
MESLGKQTSRDEGLALTGIPEFGDHIMGYA